MTERGMCFTTAAYNSWGIFCTDSAHPDLRPSQATVLPVFAAYWIDEI